MRTEGVADGTDEQISKSIYVNTNKLPLSLLGPT